MPPEDRHMPRTRDADSLLHACAREGCPVCLIILESMERYMANWQNEGFTEVEHRHTLIRIRGFCPLHTWQLAKRNNTFQLAQVYNEVLTEMLDDLDHNKSLAPPAVHGPSLWRKKRSASSAETTVSYEQCPICLVRRDIEERLVSTFVQAIPFAEMQAAFHTSTGLCLPHFVLARSMAEASNDAEQVSALLTGQRLCMQHVVDELQDAIRKHDYRFGDEARGAEMTAWRRAAMLCVGNDGVR